MGNQPWVLSRYERKLGCKSDLVVNYSTWLQYNADRYLTEYGEKSLTARFRRAWFSFTSPFRYEVLHYYFGRSFTCWDDYGNPNVLWFSDLRMAKLIGRKVFMTLQGCDARMSINSVRRNEFTPCREGHCGSASVCLNRLDTQRRYLVEKIIPLADRVFILNPDLAYEVSQAVFLPYASVEVESFETAPPKTQGKITILHAPSDPLIKGSTLIHDAVARLKSHFPIEFILLERLPHTEALKVYKKADLVIDQVLCGWYGGLAVEAMALAKPVACYIRDADLDAIPPEMAAELPIIRITPTTIESDLENMILRRQEWPEWGRKSREFVLRWHNPEKIAKAMLKSYAHPQSLFVLDVAS